MQKHALNIHTPYITVLTNKYKDTSTSTIKTSSSIQHVANSPRSDIDLNFSHPFADSDDPLLRQLPPDLVPFVQTPHSEFDSALSGNYSGMDDSLIDQIKHKPDRSCQHLTSILLSSFCCCYPFFRTRIVKQGQVMLTQNVGVPEIYGAGIHTILSPFNNIIKVQNVTDSVIRNGPIHIISVEVGQLGYGVNMQTGRPVLLTRGKHWINDQSFIFKKFIKLNKPRTELDNMEIIRVETGSVGYCFRQGKLVILEPGLHVIVPPDRFGGMMTTQMTILDLPLAVHETSDYVPLAIKSAVFYRIDDPYKALVRIQNVSQQIKETSIATLAGIIRSSSLADVASRSRPFYHKKRNNNSKDNKENNGHNDNNGDSDVESKKDVLNDDENENQVNGINSSSMNNIAIGESSEEFGAQNGAGGGDAQPFFQHVHDEFIQSLHDHVLDDWGIEIQNIRIESLRIDDNKLQSDISKQAIDVSKQHNQYLMLQKRQEIVTVEAQTRATKIEIDTRAEVNRKIQQAKADADSIVIRAKAEKKAIELKGQGDAEYARLIQSTKLGGDIARMKIQASALKGLKQVAYVPHLNPLLTHSKDGLFTMRANLNAVPSFSD